MLAAAKPALAPRFRVLLVGEREEDFFVIRDILERNHSVFPAELEHARSLEEAKAVLQQRPFGLVLFEHEAGNIESVRLITEFLHSGLSIPFILLTEDADEKSVAEIIQTGPWNCVARSQLDGATLVRTIRSTLALHSLQREQQDT